MIRTYIKYTLVSATVLSSLFLPVNGSLGILPLIQTENALEGENEPEIAISEPVIPPILERIAFCESSGEHFNEDGSVKRGTKNPQDIGMFQINEFYHLEAAESMGIDIYSEQGNIDYALYLYETQGTAPWTWSQGCWG